MDARACRAEERAGVVAAATRIFRPAGSPDLGVALPLLLGPDNVANLRVVEDGGQILAHAGVCFRDAVVHHRRVRVALLGCVYCEPEARGRGLATQAVGDAIEHARRNAADLVMASGSGPLYRRLGFVDAPPMTRWPVAAVVAPVAGPTSIRLEPATVADVAALLALHDAEPVRFAREESHWRLFLETRWLVFGPAELWLVRRPAAASPAASAGHLAYLAVQRVRILDYAGDRAAVVAGAAALAGVSGREQTLWQRPGDDDLTQAALAAGLAPETFTFPMSALWLAAPPAPLLPWCGLDYV